MVADFNGLGMSVVRVRLYSDEYVIQVSSKGSDDMRGLRALDRRRHFAISIVILGLVSASSAGVPVPPELELVPVATGLATPVVVTNAGDGSNRLFIVEKAGRIRIVENGTLLATPFLDIDPVVNSSGNEQGLLGLAFHPNYEGLGYFYVNYTDGSGDTVVSRFSVTPGDPNIADPGSGFEILSIVQPYSNHNGGQIEFGPDGYLYIGMGDGGSAGDPDDRAQNLAVLLGKMLRIDIDNSDPPLAYRIPADNPFVDVAGAAGEIWAYGLRNPWRFSFDRTTGDLFIGDVGQNLYEEIDFQPASSTGGENWGWRCYEGEHPTTPPVADPSPTSKCRSSSIHTHRVGVRSPAAIVIVGSRPRAFVAPISSAIIAAVMSGPGCTTKSAGPGPRSTSTSPTACSLSGHSVRTSRAMSISPPAVRFGSSTNSVRSLSTVSSPVTPSPGRRRFHNPTGRILK